MNFRRAAKEDYMDGADVGSLKGFMDCMAATDVWIALAR